MKIITMLTAWVELRVKRIPLRLNEFEDAYEKAHCSLKRSRERNFIMFKDLLSAASQVKEKVRH